MQFEKGAKLYSYEVEREGGEDILYFNYQDSSSSPNLAAYPEVMDRTVDALIENPNVSRIIFVKEKNYNYDFRETGYLLEIASLYVYFLKQEEILSHEKLVSINESFFPKRYNDLFSFLYLLKKDPIASYFELKRILIDAKIFFQRVIGDTKIDQGNYIRFLEKIFGIIEKTKIIQAAIPYFENYRRGNREIYSKLFQPDIIPNFTFTRLVSDLPTDSEMIDQYEVSIDEFDISNVTILKRKNESKLFYHLSPPESLLTEEENYLMNLAKGVLIEHQPKAEEFTDVSRTRKVFFNVSKDLLRDLAQSKGIKLTYLSLMKLSAILVRHTIGFGLIEILLQDKNLQDVSLNAPISQTPVYVRHQDYDECNTNILPSREDSDSWAAKFRMISGRPLDEANPILDTQLEIGKIRARIAIIQEPLSPDGLAYSIRRHRESPWTLPLFIKNKMLNPLGAGLLSFLVDGSRTLLIAGTRSSGKTSLLGSLMLEINSKSRIITVEDSLELPVEALRKLNYNILRMKVRSALLKSGAEVSADDGIRTSLRLGDSSLIVGEVRSVEAKALYEAMRVGALANVVAGTIHGASPYGVFDRVVNDLGVPATSFKATDIIAVANPIKSADGLHSWRRLLEISEVKKHWKEDPVREKGFSDLMSYSVEKDELEASDALINGESDVIKDLASKVRGWAGNWDAVYDNILLRAKVKNEIVNLAELTGKKEILEAEFNAISNHQFHKISDEVIEEAGLPMSDKVFPRWQKWLNSEIKK
ncbi:type II/IV secretion system ATPase subunit [Candidatus Pacearchaeota archaeon]|nr:type II/IV secretion system ATPase subunit [Candidatus Pacearchaeota archaeon]